MLSEHSRATGGPCRDLALRSLAGAVPSNPLIATFDGYGVGTAGVHAN